MRPDERDQLLTVAREMFRNDFQRWELVEVVRASAKQRGIPCSLEQARRIAGSV